MTIRLLDESTISKIAAGEIIENPASIIKELLENSIDANAKNIVIEVKGSIGEFLRITDDGEGIRQDEIELAFMRHSTSKLRKVEDLYNIMSLGFRGEALASISHISHVEIMTKSKDEKVGTRAVVENGQIIQKNNVGLPIGTTFYIKDVFYNTPVRKKYLKNDTTEFGYIQDVVQKIALGNDSVSIKLIRDGKIIINTNKELDLKNHIYTILGRDISSNLIESSFKSESYKIKAFFSNNLLYRSNRNHQYIYINGRFVKNLDIAKQIEKKYYSLIPLNRYPVFILYISIDPILVDVNIHPKKHEVKLSRENNLLAILSEMIEEVLYPNRSIEAPKVGNTSTNTTVFEMFSDINPEKNEIIEENFLLEDTANNKNITKTDYIDEMSTNMDNSNNISNDIIAEEYESLYEKPSSSNVSVITDTDTMTELNAEAQIDESLLNTRIAGTLFKTYIILENANTGLCYLVDQHAAHERVLYEKFKQQYETSEIIPKQMLIKSEIFELSTDEMINVLNNIPLLSQLGFDIEEFGENSIIIRAIPILFGEPSLNNFIHDLISALDRDIHSNYEADPYKIMKKACKAAVKAGDKLSNIEIEGLIKYLIKCDNPYTCPHGRPTIIKFSKSELEKLFLREV